jgi:hypothetical protein
MQYILVKNLCDKALTLMLEKNFAVKSSDSRAFLPPMLEGVKGVIYRD